MARFGVSVAVVVACAFGSAALAGPDMAQVIKDRQANYKKIGDAFKQMRDGVKEGTATPAMLLENAKVINGLAPHIPSWFPAGSGPEAGVKTAAKAEIWQRRAEFDKDAADLAAQTPLLVKAAEGGDISAIVAQMKATGAACGTCHKAFKEKTQS